MLLIPGLDHAAAGTINLPLAGMSATAACSRRIRRQTTSASDKADEQADLPNLGGSIMTYTAEDFAGANLATKGRFEVARRTDPHHTHQWHVYGGRRGWFSDEGMAADGWVPVVEATEATQNRHDVAAYLGQISSLSKRLVAAGDQIESQRIALEDLQEENYRLERSLQAPLSLDRLEAAWGAAEVPTEDAPIREGDVVIEKISASAYAVMSPPPTCGLVGREFRVLSRAPKREPWQDLADVLRGTVWERLSGDVDGLAAAVHAAGWRKGGEEA